MARKPASKADFILFDALYDDGSQRSNRRVPSDLLAGPDADAAVLSFLRAQDREIEERSHRPMASLKTVRRSR